MSKIIFDIETAGQDFDSLDEKSQEYFLKYADTLDKEKEAKESLSFYPVTAQIVAIGMLEIETDKAFVFFQDGGQNKKETQGNITYVGGDEKEILTNFWRLIGKADTFITFNGRCFDCPFIMIRSAIHRIRASKNLMPYRYGQGPHVDLFDQLSFLGAVQRRFSLDMWCKAFGIKSPKEDGVTGLQVKDLFYSGRYFDIAQYCARDLMATKELYSFWEDFLKF